MTAIRKEWCWYVASYILLLATEEVGEEYTVHGYLIYADNAEEAYTKALALGETLGDGYRYRDDQGRVITINYIGLHDLDNLQEKTLEDETHLFLLTMNDFPHGKPRVRKKSELTLFDQYFKDSPASARGDYSNPSD
ncbi:MAG: DUF4288 domain-containing protein [Cyanobacteria bacterium J06639_16]